MQELDALQQFRILRENEGPANDLAHLLLLRRIACCQVQLGSHEAATHNFLTSIAIGDRCLEPDNRIVAVTKIMLANALVQLQRKSEALVLYSLNLSLASAAVGIEDPLVTGALYGMALCYQEQGDKDAARLAYQRCSEALLKAGQTDAAHSAMAQAVSCQDFSATGGVTIRPPLLQIGPGGDLSGTEVLASIS